MKKIVLLPLDERPCNYRYPQMLFQENAAFSLTVPDVSIMPDKKQAADFEKIRKWDEKHPENSIGTYDLTREEKAKLAEKNCGHAVPEDDSEKGGQA